MPHPLVSIVMCTYNGAFYVGEQLQSILQQTYTNIEVIIADDASSDNTYEVLKPYAEKDKRIVLYRNEKNVGYNINFSEACSRTKGAFIAIADQDDVWELKKIETLLQKIEEDASIVLVHGISARFEERAKPHLRSLQLINYFRGNDIRLFFLSNYISGHNMLFRRLLLQHSLPFPSSVYYDWWLAANACVLGRIEFVNEILVWHRMHQTNVTGAAKPKLAFYKQVQTILPLILQIKGIPANDYEFGKKLLEKFKDFPEKKFSWRTFSFLLKQAQVIFSYKKRSFPWASYIKHAFKYSLRNTRS